MHAASPLISRTATTRPWYAQRWPWLLMLGPALVVVAGSYTGYLAFTRQDALVVDDYYMQGKAINQDLRRDRAASALKMRFEANYDAATGVLAGRVDSFGRPFTAPLHLYLAHATQPAKDIARDLRPDAQGRFSVALPDLGRARWQVLVEGQQREWRLAAVWHWPLQSAVAIDADPVRAP